MVRKLVTDGNRIVRGVDGDERLGDRHICAPEEPRGKRHVLAVCRDDGYATDAPDGWQRIEPAAQEKEPGHEPHDPAGRRGPDAGEEERETPIVEGDLSPSGTPCGADEGRGRGSGAPDVAAGPHLGRGRKQRLMGQRPERERQREHQNEGRLGAAQSLPTGLATPCSNRPREQERAA